MADLRASNAQHQALPAESAPLLGEAPTDSHALATANPELEDVGVAQLGHGESNAKDLGWNNHPQQIPDPLVGGLTNQQLWQLIRRFNMQMYHVKAIADAPLGGLDLIVAEKDDFSPAKMRNNVERLYISVGIGMMAFWKHMARLSSWNEQRRSTAFCIAYFVAWWFDLILPALFTMLVVLITYVPSRDYLFPPMPMALVSKSGELKKPKAGMLGSDNTMTGAPERFEGEAAEREASNFVSTFTAISLSSATGEHMENNKTTSGGVLDRTDDKPNSIASHAAEAKDAASGRDTSSKSDKTKQPMETQMWDMTRPAMHAIGSIADVWERFGNVLSPAPPFPRWTGRLKLVAVLTPLILVTVVVNSHMFAKGCSFGIGASFFGRTLLMRPINWLNEKYPGWTKYLALENSLLKGVPTNAQLTLTLLRIGEANKAPLPPPQRSQDLPPTKPLDVKAEDLPMDVHPVDVADAVHPEPEYLDEVSKEKEEHATGKKKHGSKAVAFFKNATKAAVSTVLGGDSLRAKAGSLPAKNRLGVVSDPKDDPDSGPVKFRARHKGKKGNVLLDATTAHPTIAFAADSASPDDQLGFCVSVKDIVELQKVPGLGWKSKLVVGWAMDSKIATGLRIRDRFGSDHFLTAVELSDELFNRLIAMGGQIWESW